MSTESPRRRRLYKVHKSSRCSPVASCSFPTMTVESNTIALVAADHPIKTATIFQSSTAEVTRDFTTSLKVCSLYHRSILHVALTTVLADREAET